jgi:hypothetical protein
MNQITDTSGNPLTHVALVQAPSSESGVIVIRVPCSTGQKLKADAGADARVLARLTGSGASFQDIGVTPISLTPYADSVVSFDVKIQTGAVSQPARAALPVRVTYQI